MINIIINTSTPLYSSSGAVSKALISLYEEVEEKERKKNRSTGIIISLWVIPAGRCSRAVNQILVKSREVDVIRAQSSFIQHVSCVSGSICEIRRRAKFPLLCQRLFSVSVHHLIMCPSYMSTRVSCCDFSLLWHVWDDEDFQLEKRL